MDFEPRTCAKCGDSSEDESVIIDNCLMCGISIPPYKHNASTLGAFRSEPVKHLCALELVAKRAYLFCQAWKDPKRDNDEQCDAALEALFESLDVLFDTSN